MTHALSNYDDRIDYTKKSINRCVVVSVVLLTGMVCVTYAMYRASIPAVPELAFDPGNTCILLAFNLVSVVTEFFWISDYVRLSDKRKSR
jgi:hypothetical protein